MSYKRHHAWWGYIKAVVRKYRYTRYETGLIGIEARETDAVRRAIKRTIDDHVDGEQRVEFIDVMYWRRTRTLEGAAMDHNISNSTAWRWHGDFIKLVAVEMGLADPEPESQKENSETQQT